MIRARIREVQVTGNTFSVDGDEIVISDGHNQHREDIEDVDELVTQKQIEGGKRK